MGTIDGAGSLVPLLLILLPGGDVVSVGVAQTRDHHLHVLVHVGSCSSHSLSQSPEEVMIGQIDINLFGDWSDFGNF